MKNKTDFRLQLFIVKEGLVESIYDSLSVLIPELNGEYKLNRAIGLHSTFTDVIFGIKKKNGKCYFNHICMASDDGQQSSEISNFTNIVDVGHLLIIEESLKKEVVLKPIMSDNKLV